MVRDRLNVPGRGVEQLVCQIGEGARRRDFLADLRRLPVLGVAASCTLAAQAAAAPCQALVTTIEVPGGLIRPR